MKVRSEGFYDPLCDEWETRDATVAEVQAHRKHEENLERIRRNREQLLHPVMRTMTRREFTLEMDEREDRQLMGE